MNRWQFVVVVVGLVASATTVRAWPTPQPGAVPAGIPDCDFVATGHGKDDAKRLDIDLTIPDDVPTVRVAVALSDPPSTRLRLSFDGARGGHVEVDWDPTVSSELGRTVTLSSGTWRVSPSVEPSTYTQQMGSVILNVKFDADVGHHGQSLQLEGVYKGAVAALNVGSNVQPATLPGLPSPTLSLTCVDKPKLGDMRFAPPLGGSASGLRGFGLAPAAVSDTLSLLAEIAVERAKAGAMKILKSRLVDPFCTGDSKITLAKLHLGASDDLALPRTCQLLSSIRLEDILSSGHPLLIALRDDLRRTIAPVAITTIAGTDALAETVLQAALTLVNGAIDRGGIDALDGQLALQLLGNVDQLDVTLPPEVVAELHASLAAWVASLTPPYKPALLAALSAAPPRCATATCTDVELVAKLETFMHTPLASMKAVADDTELIAELQAAIASSARANRAVGYACEIRLAVATIKRCQHDGCSAQDLAGMISKPEDYFAADHALPLALCWNHEPGPPEVYTYRQPPEDLVALQQLVLDGIRMVAPVVDGKGRDRAKAAVHLLVELLEREGDPRINRYAGAFAEIADALIDEDYATALNQFLALASKLQPGNVPPQMAKVVQLIGAVSSYAAVYTATKGEDPKAAHEARKHALEGLIDSATDRTDRDGDWILSVGSNVGLSATWSKGFRTEGDWGKAEPSVRVPLGLALDLPRWSCVTLHLGIQLADLGQFVHRSDNKLDDVRWDDFVSPGVELGVSIPKLDRALNLSVHAAYAPTIPTDPSMARDGVWRVGLSVGYYVPFFDFN